jgi:ketosteroid isomerase-like protein
MQKLLDGFQAAFNAGDNAAVSALYTEDAIRMPPGEDLIRGRAEIAARNEAFSAFKIKLQAYGGLMDGDVGSTWGTYELYGTVDGQPVTVKGRWMNATKKTSDGWKIFRDIWHEMERS